MKTLLIFGLTLFSLFSQAQTDSMAAVNEIKKFQDELNSGYSSKETSPLDNKARKKFKGHKFFPINLDYRVEAELRVTENLPVFKMKTSTERLADYKKYGELIFTIKGEEMKLNVYQSTDLLKRAGYEDYLFLPFTDLTNGNLSYSGGRYIDLRIPKEGNTIVLDFNQAYNPYCAYSDHYSCPIVPAENHLNTEILAGVKMAGKKK